MFHQIRYTDDKGVLFYVSKAKVRIAIFFMIALLSFAFFFGYSFFQMQAEFAYKKQLLIEQKNEISDLRNNFNTLKLSLSKQLGEMHTYLARLSALGTHLSDLAQLDSIEFDFSTAYHEYSVGGTYESSKDSINTTLDINEFEELIKYRDYQLRHLANFFEQKDIKDASQPSQWPVKSGWLSSPYGKRVDPFHGKLAMHKGIDFAGKENDPVYAIGAGVVIFSGYKFGFGELVSVYHGNGYTSRYAHNKSLLANIGDIVEKGSVVAKMGSTGRSTGPHVHLEVLYNGRHVDPQKYIKR